MTKIRTARDTVLLCVLGQWSRDGLGGDVGIDWGLLPRCLAKLPREAVDAVQTTGDTPATPWLGLVTADLGRTTGIAG